MLTDSHVHLDLMENMQVLIREFAPEEVGAIAVTTTPKAYDREKAFCAGSGNIKVALGFHPQLVAERYREIDLFLDHLDGAAYIGEIGLDFNSAHIASKQQQIACFREIVMECARTGGKVLSIHSVKAAGTTLDELENAEVFGRCLCIFHWFTGTPAERRRAVEAGAYFSINPKMLLTKSGRETISIVPSNRLLLETDAPFTMHIPHANNLKSELVKLLRGISEIRREDMSSIIAKNAEKIMAFPS